MQHNLVMPRIARRSSAILLAGFLVLGGCGGDSGTAQSSGTPPPPPPPATGSGNVAPTISGTPNTTGVSGTYYSFTPVAADANNDALTFSVKNLPTWATFSSQSGAITGMLSDADVGTYSDIRISVSDGSLSADLPPFSVSVSAAPPPTTRATYDVTHTYTLPTVRPYISLNDYASASKTSAAYLRLKSEVDDAVSVTAAHANGTYDQLVNALNADHYGYSVVDSVILFRLTGDAKYIQQAITMVNLFVTSENALISAGSAPVIAGDSYLDVGDYLEQLALTYDYGYSQLTPAQRTAWAAYADQTIKNVWNYSTASWGGVSHPWSGWSVSDPGDNYFYSFLKATQLWSLASQNMTTIKFLQTDKYTILIPYFYALPGGGSREGTGYGTSLGSLFENYAYWKSSVGEDLSAYSTHARNTIDYWIYATVPTFDYYAAIGDQARSSMPRMFDYQRKLVEEAVALNPGTAQGMRGIWWLNRIKVDDGGGGTVLGKMRYNYDFRYDLLQTAGTEQAPTGLMYDATGTGVLFARSDWTTSASWMHTIAGIYDQSHAHQDQGGFSFYKGGWLSITSNVFSNSGINQDVGTENVVRFMANGNAIPQNNSTSTKAVSDSGGVLQVNENLTPAYSDNANQVSSWLRDFTYTRSTHTIKVHDRCTVGGGVTPVWQLHLPVKPVLQGDGSYLAGKLHITPLLPATPAVAIVDMRTVSSDYTGSYRLEITGSAGSCEFEVNLQAQ